MSESSINADNLIEELRVALPELEEAYQQELRKWKGKEYLATNYIIVGSVLQPYFQRAIAVVETDSLRRCAVFMERVCRDGDTEAINVIWVRVFEWLIFRPQELKLVWPFLGPATRENIKDAAQRWSSAKRFYGQTENLPEDNVPRGPD
jgi:hypothetical protein